MDLKHELKENTWLTHCAVGWGNGYVILPPGHPAHGKHYNDIDVDVHGGLSYASKDEDGNWKVGFDTAHHGDTPEKWPMSRVEEETLRLKAQLESMQ